MLSCPQLRSLNVSGCSALEHVSLACPGLESLSAAQLPRLQALQQEHFACPRLREANFAGCKKLAGAASAVRGILVACTNACRAAWMPGYSRCIEPFRTLACDDTGELRKRALPGRGH